MSDENVRKRTAEEEIFFLLHGRFPLRAPSEKDFPIYEEAIYEQISYSPSFPVGVHPRCDPELRRRVEAAVASYTMGLKSIDYTMKHYITTDHSTSEARLDNVLVQKIRDFIGLLMVNFKGIGQTDDSAGHLMAGISLVRVTSALEGALLLSFHGYIREVCSILRSLLEQLAWCASVRWEPKDEDRLLRLTGETCLKNLKVLYPGAGKLYGILSEIVHHHPKRHFFVSWPKNDGEKIGVYAQHPDYKLCCFVALLVFCDIHGTVVEALYYDEVCKRSFLTNAGFKANRFTIKSLLEIKRRYSHALVDELMSTLSHC